MVVLLVGNFPGCLWGGPWFEVDFCLEPCIHSGSTWGFPFGSVKKSVGPPDKNQQTISILEPNMHVNECAECVLMLMHYIHPQKTGFRHSRSLKEH